MIDFVQISLNPFLSSLRRVSTRQSVAVKNVNKQQIHQIPLESFDKVHI